MRKQLPFYCQVLLLHLFFTAMGGAVKWSDAGIMVTKLQVSQKKSSRNNRGIEIQFRQGKSFAFMAMYHFLSEKPRFSLSKLDIHNIRNLFFPCCFFLLHFKYLIFRWAIIQMTNFTSSCKEGQRPSSIVDSQKASIQQVERWAKPFVCSTNSIL